MCPKNDLLQRWYSSFTSVAETKSNLLENISTELTIPGIAYHNSHNGGSLKQPVTDMFKGSRE